MTHTASSPARTPPCIWSKGSWFGPLFGCTVWLVALASATSPHDVPASLGVLFAYFMANVLGWLLWSRRSSLRAATALQIQLGVTLVLAIAALLVVDLRVTLVQLDMGFSTPMAFCTLLIYPLLMFVFWRRNRVGPAG